MSHPLNRYQNYEQETGDAYEYEKHQYELEEEYWKKIDDELDRDYFGWGK